MGGAGAWAVVLTGEAIGSLLGGLAALRLRPRRPMLVVRARLHAVEPPARPARRGRAVRRDRGRGFAGRLRVRVRHRDLRDGAAATIAPEKLSRVASFNWLVAMSMLPIGYAIAGPVADAIGISTYLWIGAIWVVVSAIGVALVPSVRNLRTDVVPEAAPAT